MPTLPIGDDSDPSDVADAGNPPGPPVDDNDGDAGNNGDGDGGEDAGAPGAEGEGEEPVNPCGDRLPDTERCSFADEDCDGENNEGLDCTFIAASARAVWSVDPFEGRVSHMMDVDPPAAEVLFDLDVAIDGTLLVTAGRTLYRLIDGGILTAFNNGALPFNPNGLAVAADGRAYVANHDTLVGSRVVRADAPSEPPTFFSSLSPWDSSGDCVHHKGELFITADGESSDQLLVMSTSTGEVLRLGDMEVAGVMGLSSAFGFLFGLTNEGQILLVDPDTGATQLLHTSTVAFTGAASRR